MATLNTIMLQRCITTDNRGLVLKSCIDSTITVVSQGKEVAEETHNGISYIECKVGDMVSVYYDLKKYSRRFKVVGIDTSGQFYICEIVYSLEEDIEIQIKELQSLITDGKITTNQAHLKADELLVTLLYNKGFDKIADAFTALEKWYE